MRNWPPDNQARIIRRPSSYSVRKLTEILMSSLTTACGERQFECRVSMRRATLCQSVAALLCLGAMHPVYAENSFASPDDPTKRTAASQPKADSENLFNSEALERFYEGLDTRRANFFKSTGLKAGFFHSTVFQYASRSAGDSDKYGVATISGLYGTWDAVRIGDASAGQISFGLEARWGYGNTLTPSETGARRHSQCHRGC